MIERRTPFYAGVVAAGATMGRVGGEFVSAHSYSGVADEHLNTRANVGVQDLSTMGKLDIKGPGAEALLDWLLVNNVAAMRIGQVLYSTVCRKDGGILDDLTLFKLGDEHFLLVTGSVNRSTIGPLAAEFASRRGGVYITDVTAAIAFPTIQGPRSRDLLKTLVTEADLDGLKRWRFTNGLIGETPVRISRTGVTGELGFELFVPADEAMTVWETLIAAGRDFGLKPYGVKAMFTLGLEKAYPAHGIDMDATNTPFDVGLDRFIRFDKPDFWAKDALLRIRDKGPTHRWSGLVVEGDRPAPAGAPIIFDEEAIGRVTYSDFGHSVGAMLATAHLEIAHAEVGTEVLVRIGEDDVSAHVVPIPFFDPDGLRLRG